MLLGCLFCYAGLGPLKALSGPIFLLQQEGAMGTTEEEAPRVPTVFD